MWQIATNSTGTLILCRIADSPWPQQMSSPHVDRRTLTGRTKRLGVAQCTKEQSHKILASRGDSVIGGLASLFPEKCELCCHI
jgi:hypothetical protein